MKGLHPENFKILLKKLKKLQIQVHYSSSEVVRNRMFLNF